LRAVIVKILLAIFFLSAAGVNASDYFFWQQEMSRLTVLYADVGWLTGFGGLWRVF